MPVFIASTTVFDLESQPTIPLPATIVTNDTTRTPSSAVAVERNPLDDFFDCTLSTTHTHESRHDFTVAEALPPYSEDKPPTYSLKAPEPATLAEYLFKFGFLFPPFWILGACILWSPLHAPSSESNVEVAWMPDKTESERQRLIAEMRQAEVRWALRCLWALLIVIQLGALAGVASWVILHS